MKNRLQKSVLDLRIKRVILFIFAAHLFTNLVASLAALAGTAPPCPTWLPDLIKRTKPSVVNIQTLKVQNTMDFEMTPFFEFYEVPRQEVAESRGSGVIFSKEGHIYTNHHVVDKADKIFVSFETGPKYEAKLIGKDRATDLAIIKIDPPKNVTLVPAKIGSPDKKLVGESVHAIGQPLGLTSTVTSGIISAIGRQNDSGYLNNVIQTDASINPGNSGGGLFDCAGELIGITSFIKSLTGQDAGLGFAIPISEAKKIEGDLLTRGRVARPWIGIVGKSFPRTMRSQPGVLVLKLLNRGPAFNAGILPGSIITHVEMKPTPTPLDLRNVLFAKKAGEIVDIELVYKGKKITTKVKVTELDEEISDMGVI